ncbi:M15 family metallopeptidase [Rheinheimera sp. 1928-s]|uniref:M15 family metallopeptidase n=1 Tax=Rheinheimera sp. 1928-s TaxID=3033803 RepID=UPI002601A8C4|nr:M15 family metallopeptidase [Rheinheimera sp. 1928-s]MDF3127171.1 M15 family metallopeptidase [Rheinheimera sp. 1928-s]
MKTQTLVVYSCFLLLSCASKVQQQSPAPIPKVAAAPTLNPQGPFRIETHKPADVVNILTATTKVQITMAYAGDNNFTGKAVPGYQANSCYLEENAAQALARVALQAERLGYGLQLLDCYRPQRASSHFMLWVGNTADQITKAVYYPNLDKSQLNQGYIANFSGHSRASTVDLTLLKKNAAGQWQQLDMGGTYDLFDPVSHLDSPAVSPQQKANRLLLKDLMQQQGFAAYAMEWWHFTLANEKYPDTYFDFPVN